MGSRPDRTAKPDSLLAGAREDPVKPICVVTAQEGTVITSMAGSPDEVVGTIGDLLVKLFVGFQMRLNPEQHVALKEILQKHVLQLQGGRRLTVDIPEFEGIPVPDTVTANVLSMMEKVGWTLHRKSA